MTHIDTDLWMFPLVLLIWMINGYLFIATLRLILGQLDATRDSQLCRGLAQCTDPIVSACQNWVERRVGKPVSAFWVWATTILAALVVRHLCLGILLSLS